jgi:hypothetical protein
MYDTYGNMSVSIEGRKPTYSCSVVDFTPAATATDFVTLVGAAGKTITITNCSVNGDATAAATVDIYFLKRTVLNSGGTATQPSIAKHETADIAPSGVVNQYSVNPVSLGTGVLVRGLHMSLPPSTTPGLPLSGVDLYFGNRPAKGVKLTGANETFAINWNGNAVPAGSSLYVNIEWTEEVTSVT